MLQLINCLLVEGIQISHTEVKKSELHYYFHSFSICGFYDFFWNRSYFFIIWHNSNFDRNGMVLPLLAILQVWATYFCNARKMVLKIQAFFSKIGLRLTYNQFKLN